MKSPDNTLNLPEAITAYWIAANAGRSREAAGCFSPEAIVRDEGQTHRGPEAIEAWIGQTTLRYHPQVRPLRLSVANGRHLVSAEVSGDFPGSPVELDFAFTLRDGKIAELGIE